MVIVILLICSLIACAGLAAAYHSARQNQIVITARSEEQEKEDLENERNLLILKNNNLKEEYKYLQIDYQNLDKELAAVREQINKEQDKLADIEAKQTAYLQAQQRQKEMETKQDYYRLQISNQDEEEIAFLRTFQPYLSRKDVINKVIYEGYYKQPYNDLIARVVPNDACGIYKITSLKDGQAYVGQSISVKQRWKDHIKAAIAYPANSNLLYKTMYTQGPHSFTFEILEEVPKEKLNEREAYWIDFYKTKDFDLNSTRGNSK